MDGVHGFSRQGSGVWRSLRDGDFEEEDVWAVLKEGKDYSPKVGQSKESTVSAKRYPTSAARMIPKAPSAIAAATAITSSDSSSSSREASGIRQQSAPMNIPDWSKISRKKSKKASAWCDYDDNDFGDGDGEDNDDEDDDEYNSKVPPHEILARRLARSQISSFSVFEGVGRKLKGRDLSKVRNAVLTKTGFLE